MSEIAQYIIKTRAKAEGWSLTSYPGKIKLPSDIFKAHTGPLEANKVGAHLFNTIDGLMF